MSSSTWWGNCFPTPISIALRGGASAPPFSLPYKPCLTSLALAYKPLGETYMLDGSFHSLPIAEIVVARDARQRTHLETEDLQRSIAQIGLINPIVVRLDEQGRHILVAGERRLTACRALQWEEIPVHFAHELTPIQASIIELEENIKRKDLPWQDLI